MKTATIPSLRVDQQLRESAESVLAEGESLSSFVEYSLREQIRLRQSQDAFIKRGLRSAAIADSQGQYYSADDVVAEMDKLLIEAKQRKQ